jgi:hypothetical protein
MPREGFEPTIPVFEHAKIFLASDRATTVLGLKAHLEHKTQLFLKINKKC